MIVIIIAFVLFLLLYYDNVSSIVVGGTGDRTQFQLYLVVFVLIILISGLYYGIKRKKIYFSSISVPMLILSIIIFAKNFLDGSSSYDNLRFLYSASWLIIVVGFDNIFMSLNKRYQTLFLYLMGGLFLYTVYNAFETYSYFSQKRDVFVIPTVYLCVMFLPWILQLRKENRLVSALLLIVMLFITAYSAKRGAILAVFISLFYYYYKNFKNGYRKSNSGVFSFIFFAIVGIAVLFLANDSLNGFLFERFSRDSFIEGSGRREINLYAIKSIASIDNFKDLLFGFKYNSIELENSGGHNDWLSFMMTNGLVGFLAFAFFYYVFYRHSFQGKFSSGFEAYSVIFIIMILQSMYSTSYNPTIHPLLGMMFIGYAEAQLRKSKFSI